MKMTSSLRGALALGALFVTQAASAQVAVIVNPKSPVGSMTADQVSAIFLGKSPTLPSGATAVAADLPESSGVRDTFYSKATGKTSAQVKSTWARLTFSGKAMPPKELPTSADVKKLVAATPDGIGYIEKSAVDATVKVVLTVE